jgi:hypothetical protein
LVGAISSESIKNRFPEKCDPQPPADSAGHFKCIRLETPLEIGILRYGIANKSAIYHLVGAISSESIKNRFPEKCDPQPPADSAGHFSASGLKHHWNVIYYATESRTNQLFISW